MDQELKKQYKTVLPMCSVCVRRLDIPQFVSDLVVPDKELDEMEKPCYSLWHTVFKYYSGFAHFYY